MDEDKNDKPWIYIVEVGSGPGLILLTVIGMIVYWCCMKPQSNIDRPTTSVTYTASESISLSSPNVDTRRAGQYSALGWKPVEFQEPVDSQKIVNNNDMQLAYASALLDHLEDLGTDVQSHHSRLRELGITQHCQLMFDLQL